MLRKAPPLAVGFFTIDTLPTASNATATITATAGGVPKSKVLTVNAPVLSSVSLSPSGVIGNTSATGTVKLSGKAPAGGRVVTLSSNNTAVAAPTTATVTVPADQLSAPFTINTSSVATSTVVSISATIGGTPKSANLTVKPPVPAAPSTLTASSRNAQAILNWGAPAGEVTSYKVFRRTSTGSYPTNATATVNAPTTTFTNTGLTNNTTYFYIVKAVNVSGTSTSSNEVKVTPNIVADGGFETPFLNGGYQYRPTTSPWSFVDWSGMTGNNNAVTSGNANAPEGAQVGYVQCYNGANSLISQNITLNPGRYKISLQAAKRVNYSNNSTDVQISIGGVVLTTIKPTSSTYSSFETPSFSISTAGSYTLRLNSLSVVADDGVTLLDNLKIVSGSSTPTPIAVPATEPNLSPPINLNAQPSQSQVILTWTAPQQYSSFNIKRALVSGGPYSTIATSSNTRFVDSSVVNDTSYFYVVTATRGSAESANSNEASATPRRNNNALFIAQNIPATMYAGRNYNVTVTMLNTGLSTWTSNSSYKLGSENPVYNNTWGVQRLPLTQNVTANQTHSFQLSLTAPIKPGTYACQWRMVLEGVEGFGEYTPNINVVVVADPDVVVPNAPQNLVGAGGDRSAVLNWVAPSGTVAYYNIKRSNTSGGPYISVGTASSAQYTDTGLTNRTTYYYVVSAINGAGESLNSNEVSAVPRLPNDALFISQVVPSRMAVGETYTVDITMQNSGSNDWPATAASASTGYKLGSQNPQDNSIWNVQRVAKSTVVPSGSNTTYHFNVRAPNTFGVQNFQWRMVQERVAWFGELTDNVQVTIGPHAPTELVATPKNAEVQLDWTASPDAQTYKVWRSTTSGSGYSLVASDVVLTSYNDTTVSNGTLYFYVVTSMNGSFESEYSNQVSVTPQTPNLVSLSLVPTIVDGGDVSIGTVTLASVAPAGGVSISLSSGNTNVATLPLSVFVPEGSRTASFHIQSKLVGTSTTVAITAQLGSISKSQELQVIPSCFHF